MIDVLRVCYEEKEKERCIYIMLMHFDQDLRCSKAITEYLIESGYLTVPIKNKENAADLYVIDAFAAIEELILETINKPD